MKIKTSELTGTALDWAVAKAWQPVYKDASLADAVRKGYNPSTNWEYGGPVIEREGIMLVRHTAIPALNCGEYYWKANQTYGPTPLIAAMRCFVASRLGDAIDVPDDLLNTN